MLKPSLKSFGINPGTWEAQAQDCPAWWSCTNRGATSYKQNRIVRGQIKCGLHKSRANFLPSTPADHQYLTCGRTFWTHIGLIIHNWTHCDKPSPILSLVIVDNDGQTYNLPLNNISSMERRGLCMGNCWQSAKSDIVLVCALSKNLLSASPWSYEIYIPRPLILGMLPHQALKEYIELILVLLQLSILYGQNSALLNHAEL